MLANEVRDELTMAIDDRKAALDLADESRLLEGDGVDVTLPGRRPRPGSLNPLAVVERRIVEVFTRMGYQVVEGPEIEDDWHNFEALNIPPDHPARDGFDTFYIEPPYLVRSHTSPVQIRTMKQRKPPIRVIAPGKVFRPDKPDAGHSPMFHQLEGLWIDTDVTFADLKGVIIEFLRNFFERDDLKVRFRPSFFPFTEPSMEVDIQCKRDKSEIRFGEGEDWLEILGCGMVHPNVLRNVGLEVRDRFLREESTHSAANLERKEFTALLPPVQPRSSFRRTSDTRRRRTQGRTPRPTRGSDRGPADR
jgi:phenylalanyl-tRNA synthetase alpha chain